MTLSGAAAEQRALQALLAAGLELRQQNYRCRVGEIDLVMQDGESIVFVEVKARQRGDAIDSIDQSKQHRLVQAARHWQTRHPQFCDSPMRFDAFLVQPSGEQWIQDIIEVNA